MRRLAVALAPLVSLGAASDPLPVTDAQVVRVLPHDPGAYTEGLFIDRGVLFESTGEVGASSVRRVDLATGRVIEQVAIPKPYYGEGIAPWRDQILNLTWQDQRGFRWRRQGLAPIGMFRYRGEGWALTRMADVLVMSDGTADLRFVDPASFKEIRRLRVTANGAPVTNLNELEYVDGEILANIWLTDRIVRIDPRSGRVLGMIDVAALHDRAGNTDGNEVANGIAWDSVRRRLYITGKRWPVMFEIAWPPRR